MATQKHQLQSLSRALDVLEFVEASDEPVSLTEVANALGETAPIVHRALHTLEARGYVHRRESDKRYLHVARSAGVSVLARALALLRAFSGVSATDVGTSWLARETEMDEHLVEEGLIALANEGLVEQASERGRWCLSYSLLELAAPLLNANSLDNVLQPLMQRLNQDTGETISLFHRAGDRQVVAAVLPSPHPVRYVLDVGAAFPLHLGAGGKAALAAMPESEVESLLSSDGLTQLTEHTPNREALLGELEGIRQLGYAISSGERISGASAVAAPVRDATGHLRAVLGLMMPSYRTDEDELRAMGAMLVRALEGLYVPAAESGERSDQGHGADFPRALNRGRGGVG